MSVVLTAPIPGVNTPNLPFGVARLAGLRIQLPPDLSTENKKRFVFSEMPACRRRPRVSPAPGSRILLHKDIHHAASASLLQIVSNHLVGASKNLASR
jgi:hypothetical protein